MSRYVLAPHIFYQPARSGYVCPAKRFATKGDHTALSRSEASGASPRGPLPREQAATTACTER